MGKHKKEMKKHKKQKKNKRRHHSSSSSSQSESEEWVEKTQDLDILNKKNDHVTSGESSSAGKESDDSTEKSACFKDGMEQYLASCSDFTSEGTNRKRDREIQKRLEREKGKYNPSESSRELNPYWKDGGHGLPSFKKPQLDVEDNFGSMHERNFTARNTSSSPRKNWKKCTETSKQAVGNTFKEKDSILASDDYKHDSSKKIDSPLISNENDEKLLSNKEMNKLASKLVKAEIMGNAELVIELKNKLEKARQLKETGLRRDSDEEVILTQSNSKGVCRPYRPESDVYGSSSKEKKRKVETHRNNERLRYFVDDDKHSLQKMFENEKYATNEDNLKEFVKLASSELRDKDNDLAGSVEDQMRRKKSESKINAENYSKAVNEHNTIAKSLDSCAKCIQSEAMQKHLMVSMGETIYLSLPSYEPLTEGHCLLIPVRHVACVTQLDENEWRELKEFKRALTKLFDENNGDVVFFECAMHLNRYPHMSVECVPIPKDEGYLAPIYFKKAIEESEVEWSHNKKLVSLKGRDVQKAIPKGLSYFSVSFGMDEGYAHVIEDERLFPQNFAQEIIGGMLDLSHHKWRKPRKQSFDEQSKRVLSFSKIWSKHDITS